MHINFLDGLRGVSVLLVVVSHFGLGHIVPGGLGVTIFFFISGFIITKLLLIELESSATINLKWFYLRRFFRLAPALLVYVAISCAVMSLNGENFNLQDVMAVLFYFANYWGLYHGFENANFLTSPWSIIWSLSIEEHFYFLFPGLVILVRPNRKLLTVSLLICLSVLLWRVWLAGFIGLENMNHYRIYKSSDTRIDSILYGVITAILFKELPQKTFEKLGNSTFFTGGMVLLIISLAIRNEIFRETLRYTLQGLAFIPVFFYLTLKSNGAWLNKILEYRWIMFIGKISYSLYIYHWLSISIAERIIEDKNSALFNLIGISLSAILSCASYFYIERPFNKYRKRFGSVDVTNKKI